MTSSSFLPGSSFPIPKNTPMWFTAAGHVFEQYAKESLVFFTDYANIPGAGRKIMSGRRGKIPFGCQGKRLSARRVQKVHFILRGLFTEALGRKLVLFDTFPRAYEEFLVGKPSRRPPPRRSCFAGKPGRFNRRGIGIQGKKLCPVYFLRRPRAGETHPGRAF